MYKKAVPQQLQQFGFTKLKPKTKIPIEKDWTKKPYTHTEIERWLNDGGNYGVIGGYNDLVIVDADTERLATLVRQRLPDTFTDQTPKKGHHFYYICPGVETMSLNVGDVHYGEIRGVGSQTVGPGSIHPDTGTEYTVSNDVQIAHITKEELYSALSELIEIELPAAGDEDKGIGGSIVDVLKTANVEMKTIGNQLVGEHPIHGSTTGGNFVVNPDKNVWHCFRCDSGGGILSLIAVLEGIIPCDEAKKGGLKGDKYKAVLKVAKEKYGIEIAEPKAFTPSWVADRIQAERILFFTADTFYEYKTGVYKKVAEQDLWKWIKDIVTDRFSIKMTNEVAHCLQTDLYRHPDSVNAGDRLNLKNGILDMTTLTLSPHTPYFYSTIQLPVNYYPKAKCPKWEKTLQEIFQGDNETIQILQEFFGMCLSRDVRYAKVLICAGSGANGKSTVLYVLECLIGKENRVSISLGSLGNKNYVAELYGKLASISSESETAIKVCDDTLKAIVTGDTISGERKFKQPFWFQPFCKMVFAVNTLPRVEDKTDGYYRRILIIPFEKVFKEEEQNKMLRFELVAEELDGIFIWCLEGLKRLRERGYFKVSEKMRKEVQTHRKNNNSVLLFVEDKCSLITESTKIKDDSYKITKDELYKAYAEWCKEGNHHPLNKNNFGSNLKALFKGIITEVRDSETRWWVGIKIGDGVLKARPRMSEDDIDNEIEAFGYSNLGGGVAPVSM